MSTVLSRLVLAVMLGCAATGAVAGEPPTTPFPAIETGMHGAAINRIDVLADAGLLASVADDKTLRLWDLKDGDLSATVRVPLGPGAEGKLYAVAAQPGGKLVAVAGWTGVAWDGGSFFYLIDRTSGRIKGRVGPFPSTINHLAFSRDGRLLAVAFAGGVGLKVFDLTVNGKALEDPDFRDAVTWADFSPDGRLAAVALDGTVKLYGADLKPLAATRVSGKPFSVAFSGDGQTLAIGYLDAARVSLHGARDLKARGELVGPKDKSGNLSVVAFANGSLYAGGTLGNAAGVRYLMRLPLAGGRPQEIAVGTDTVVDLRPAPDGGIVFASAEPAWGVVDANGQLRQRHDRGFADLRDGYQESFRLSRDGASVSFGLQQGGRRPLTFSLAQRSLSAGNLTGGAPLLESASLKPTGWQNGREPRLNGRLIPLEDNEVARSVAVSTGPVWLLGTDFYLRAYDGDRLLWKVALPATGWAVNLAPEAGVAVVGTGDGTIRWYGLRDGAERLALFAHVDGRRWIAWTPEGFFDHSTGGDRLFGYHLNNREKAKNREGEFVDAAQLYGPFFRRDLVIKKFQGTFEPEIAAQVGKIGDVRQVLSRGLPPKLDVLEYCVGQACRPVEDGVILRGNSKNTRSIETQANEIVLRIRQEDRGGGVGQLIVRRNGANVVAAGDTRSAQVQGGRIDEVRVALQPGDNEINLSATNASGQIEASALEQLTVRIKLAADDSRLPRLHVLAIGVSKYKLSDLNLVNAANDAEAVAKLMRDTRHKLYREAVVTTLVDKDAGNANIAAAFGRLSKDVAANDTVLVFFAGHGIAVDGRYYFIPHDLPEQTTQAIVKHGFSQQQLSEMLAGLKASRVVLMVDTCFAGSIDVGDIARKARDDTWVESLSRSSGRFTLAGTTNEQEALDGLHGNGVFTSVVLKALAGDADMQVSGDKDGKVNVYELARYTKAKVPEAVREVAPDHKQEPTYHFAGSDFFDIKARE